MKQLSLIFLSILLVGIVPKVLQAQDAGVISILSPTDESCGSASHEITVVVKNFGGSTLTNVSVSLSVTGSGSLSTTGSISSISAGNTDTLTFSSTLNTVSGGTYTVKANTSVSGDVNTSNDETSVTVDINPSSLSPVTKDASRCHAGTATLEAVSQTSGATTTWYTSSSSYTAHYRGDKYTDNFSKTNTYYASSAKLHSQTSTFAAGNGQQGNMTDVLALKTVHIDSFALNIRNSNSDTVEVYFKEGTLLGSETTSSNWTLLGKDYITAKGEGNPTYVSVGDVTLEQGKTYAFYFYLQNYQDIRYTNGADTTKGTDLWIYNGRGKSGFFGGTFNPRRWNGTIHYSECSSPRLPVTVEVKYNGAQITADVSQGAIQNKGTLADPDEACPGDTLLFYVKAPFFTTDSDYGSKWTITNAKAATGTGITSGNISVISPSSGDPAEVIFYPSTSEQDSVFAITFDITNSVTGCDTSIMRYVHVSPTVNAGFSGTNSCHYSPAYFTNQTTTSGTPVYIWDFDDGNGSGNANPQHTFAQPGNYSVKLYAVSGACIDSATKQVTVYPSPATARIDIGSPFTGLFKQGTSFSPDEVCEGDTVTYEIIPPSGLSNSDFGTSWFVTSLSLKTTRGTISQDTALSMPNSSDNGSLKFFPSAGFADSLMVLSVGLQTAPGGCDTVYNRYILVHPRPATDFDLANTCFGNSVTFKNKTTLQSGNINKYQWDFGDGNSLTVTNTNDISYKYTQPGTYEVSLSAVTDIGCQSVMKKTVEVYQLPDAQVSNPVSGCVSYPVQFTDQSVANATSMASWNWSFGNGDVSTQQDPVYTYNQAGTYTVKLVIENSNGCRDSITKQITIYNTPVAAYNYINACVGKNVNFANQSTNPGGGLPTYVWDFGDGSTSSLASPSHTFTAAGTYDVKLVVISSSGCSDTIVKQITPYAPPAIDLGHSGACLGSPTTLNDSVTHEPGTIYQWHFGDGSSPATIAQNTATHTYTAEGTYTVKLVKTNPGGCKDSTTMQVTIYGVPVAQFDADDVCAGIELNFDNTSTVSSGAMTYMWDFGDGETSTDEDPAHTYTQAGTYKVSLVAIGNGGCTHTVQQNVTVHPLPVIDAWQANVKDLEVSFTPADESFASYSWDFGDGETSTDVKPVHTYAQSGEYTVKLTVTSDDGCTATRSEKVTAGESGINDPAAGNYNVRIYPNPFASITNIRYTLTRRSMVVARVYDVNGRQLAELNAHQQQAGQHTLNFDSKEYGLSSGIYFLQLVIDDQPYSFRIVKTE